MNKLILITSSMGFVALGGISLSIGEAMVANYVTYAQVYMLMLSSMASALLLSLTIIEATR